MFNIKMEALKKSSTMIDLFKDIIGPEYTEMVGNRDTNFVRFSKEICGPFKKKKNFNKFKHNRFNLF